LGAVSALGEIGWRSAAGASRAGRFLALVALWLQLVAPVIAVGSLPLPGAFGDLFDQHAICHAADTERPNPDPSPDTAPHRDHAVCCLWHGNASASVPAPVNAAPVALVYAAVSFAAPTSPVIAARPHGAARARAPPKQA
jgi:hypothetical protein